MENLNGKDHGKLIFLKNRILEMKKIVWFKLTLKRLRVLNKFQKRVQPIKHKLNIDFVHFTSYHYVEVILNLS